MFTKIDHILDHKANNKFQKFWDIQSTLFDHSEIKLEINKKRKLEVPPNWLEIKQCISK